mmetsp:Transcript_6989/g.13748  ORF Transcript_6989/g.13748 Transcript_6989/m.13748 type:complete len:229 (+) Transcript_6989:433-1119(+)
MDFLSLSGSGHDTSSNSPNRLISNDDLRPVLDFLEKGLHLGGKDLEHLTTVPLLKSLANAGNNAKALAKGIGAFLSDKFTGLIEDCAPLGVAEDDPRDLSINEHISTNLTSVGTVLSNPAVLGRDSVLRLIKVLVDVIEEKERRSANNVDIGRHLALVQVLNEGLNGSRITIALPVATNEELSLASVGTDNALIDRARDDLDGLSLGGNPNSTGRSGKHFYKYNLLTY